MPVPRCESRGTDLHHIRHWVNGGRTDLDNLISLCPWHHKVVHDRGYTIAALPAASDTFTFYRPDGTPLPSCPPLPAPQGSISGTHDADITPDTIIPPWYGERLDLDHAISACFANARTDEEKRADDDGDSDPTTLHRVQVFEPEDWPERIRRYEDEYTAGPRRPLIVPIPLLGCAHA